MHQQGCAPSGGSGRDSLSLTLPASKGSWHSLACGLIFWASRIASSKVALWPLLPMSLLLSSDLDTSFKDLVDYTGPSWIIQDVVSISRFLITSAHTLLPCKVAFARVLGIRTLSSGGWASLSLSQFMCYMSVPLVVSNSLQPHGL